MEYRQEFDALGSLPVPVEAFWGIHTARALNNFPVSGQRWPAAFITAFAHVKAACATVNRDLGFLDPEIARSILNACDELMNGPLQDHVIVDPFQGGAGTSTNMNINEVIANRAGESMGGPRGVYDRVHPLDHVNLHQSTNDVFPTALKVAVLSLLKDLEAAVSRLQESLQKKETAFRDVLKVGRTQLQDAVPMTLGMEFGAYAEAVARDRWRIFKCRERIKQVNLGGTAVGTGLGAPRDYILRVTDELRRRTGLNLSRSENLVDATQNQDAFVEVSGMLKAYAVNLMKIANDLRLMASGPDAGLAEIHLPPLQAGSSIMPGKVNPVIPEMMVQIAIQVMADDHAVTLAAASANLELNQCMPLLAVNILQSLQLLTNGTPLFTEKCIDGIEADRCRCEQLMMNGKTIATALVPVFGYHAVERVVRHATAEKIPLIEAFEVLGVAKRDTIIDLLSPRRLHKLGFESGDFDGMNGLTGGKDRGEQRKG